MQTIGDVSRRDVASRNRSNRSKKGQSRSASESRSGPSPGLWSAR
jgi:hypothetical protein